MGHITLNRSGNFIEVSEFSRDYLGPPAVRTIGPKPKEGTKMLQNIQRAKRTMRQTINCAVAVLGRPAMVTLTCDKEKFFEYKKANDACNRFIEKMAYRMPEVGILRVIEKHEKGDYHIHMVMFGLPTTLPCIEKNWKGKMVHACPKDRQCERKVRVLAKIWSKGYVDAKYLNKPDRAAAYVSKYFAKQNESEAKERFGRRLFAANKIMNQAKRTAKEKGWYWRRTTYREPELKNTLDYLKSKATKISAPRTFGTAWLGDCTYYVLQVGNDVLTPMDHWVDFVNEGGGYEDV